MLYWRNNPLSRKPRFRGRRVWKQVRLHKFPWLKPICFLEYLKQFLELWTALKPFRMWKHSEISTCWRMHDSTACFYFFFEKCFFAPWFSTDLFIAVERAKDISHVKLLLNFFCLMFTCDIINDTIDVCMLHPWCCIVISACVLMHPSYCMLVTKRLRLKLANLSDLMLWLLLHVIRSKGWRAHFRPLHSDFHPKIWIARLPNWTPD